MFEVIISFFKKIFAHSHKYIILTSVENVPTNNGITSFMILFCERCKNTIFFPSENYLLTSNDYQKQLQKKLAKEGCKFS